MWLTRRCGRPSKSGWVIEQLYTSFQCSTDFHTQRMTEFMEKMQAAVKEAVGDRAADMLLLERLATAPAKQGRGYGTALCEALNDIVSQSRFMLYATVADTVTRAGQADVRGLPLYLVSSNVAANTAFYNHVGYLTVKEIYVGDNDPSWKNPPIPVALVSGPLRLPESG